MSWIGRQGLFFPAFVALCFSSIFASWKIVQKQLIPLNESFIPVDRVSNWKLWNETSILYQDLNYTCQWNEYHAPNSNETAQFCGSQSLDDSGHDGNRCDKLTELWNEASPEGKRGVYMQVGATVGQCILHMLLTTNASIVALEAQPDNLFCLTSTLMGMKEAYRNRVALYVYQNISTIHAADQVLTGNSVVRRDVSLGLSSRYPTPLLDVYTDPLDYALKDMAASHISLLKLNTMGNKCHVLDGMARMLERTRVLTFEMDKTKPQTQRCSAASLHAKLTAANFKPDNSKSVVSYKQEAKIPHRLIFTFRDNILETKEPAVFYNNIQHTIQQYREAWGEPNAPVWFLTDDKCREVIQQVNATLVQYFDFELAGKYKADICRVAALYLKGGYYFDVDLEVIQPVQLTSKTAFSTVIAEWFHQQFFQAFLASEPGSPVLAEAISEMILWYEQPESRVEGYGNIGPRTLFTAFHKVPATKRGQALLFQETALNASNFPSVPRRVGVGCCCNLVVHDPEDGEAYFYSRIVGAGGFCEAPAEEVVIEDYSLLDTMGFDVD